MSSNGASIVVVHGAWADGSSWAKVIAPLAADGFRATAAPLPLTSFRDDVAALDRTLERLTAPVVLAGHAYAGAVIAATRSEKVRALINVCDARISDKRTSRSGCLGPTTVIEALYPDIPVKKRLRVRRRSEFSPPVRDWHRWKPHPPLADAGIDKIGMELASRSVRQNLPYALHGAFPPRLEGRPTPSWRPPFRPKKGLDAPSQHYPHSPDPLGRKHSGSN